MGPKFRAWDVDACCWIPPHMFAVYGDRQHRNFLSYDKQMDKFLEDSIPVVIEQSTGLKDKNGKEVFENDFIRVGNLAYRDRFKFGDDTRKELPEGVKENDITTTMCILVVKYEFSFLSNLQQIIESNPDVIGVEVIGNIHEHPDLTKKYVQHPAPEQENYESNPGFI